MNKKELQSLIDMAYIKLDVNFFPQKENNSITLYMVKNGLNVFIGTFKNIPETYRFIKVLLKFEQLKK